jgi:phosphate transport system substrate-binding protein
MFILLTGCFGDIGMDSEIIRVKGSDTMLLLNRNLAEQFMRENPGISVYVEGGGTTTGVKALLNNSVEICAASRPLEPVEIKQLGENFNTVGMSFLIGRDALSIYINPDNKVRNLTIDQLNKIFKCEITNWSELGGMNKPIQPITRSSASGTYLYFRKHVLGGDNICNSIPFANTTKEITEFVNRNKNGIGYGGVGYLDGTLQCSINSIDPTRENVLNNSYPISRYLRYYTSRKPKGNVKKFIDWVTSSKGQNIVEKSGYIPLWN